MHASSRSTQLPADLGDGLVLRRATPADREALIAFNHRIHEHTEDGAPEERRVEAWVRDLASGRHPTFPVEDFTIVEDRSGRIVSSLNLIPQTWFFEDVPFKVGRPELVGTDPHYRDRGLVRKQFELIHAWGAARGELAQAITGIPYYYRLFDYEMTVTLDSLAGGRRFHVPQQIPPLKDGESEPYRIRPAGEADIPFLAECYRQGRRRWLLSADWNEDLLRYEIFGKSRDNVNRVILTLIERPSGEPVGFFAHPGYLWSPGRVAVSYFELVSGASWYEIAPVVLRHMVRVGNACIAAEKAERLDAVDLRLGAEHPAYEVLAHWSTAQPRLYAWYLRVPDLPRFINHVAPVLERRLAGSLCPGFSGTLELNFFRRTGLRLRFENGKLTAEPNETSWENSTADFPELTFLQLLTGYRSLDELQYAFPDCRVQGAFEPIFNALFPKKPSLIWPIS